MDKREQIIYEKGEKLLLERLFMNIEEIQAYVQNTPEECSEPFFQALQELLERVEIAQQEDKKSTLRYITISYLQSSLYTGSYKLRMDAYDERLYSDISETYVYWSPHFIMKYLEKDMAHFRQHIKAQIPQVQEYEIMRFMVRYSMHYNQIILQFLSDVLESAMADMQISEPLTVTFGAYMDENVVVIGSRTDLQTD